MSDEQLASILVGLAALGGRMDGLGLRLDSMEAARTLARVEQDQWKTEVRAELHEIVQQTTLTNGNVRELQMWRARINGAASVFAWWKTAMATLVVAGIVYLVAWIATSH